MVVDEFSMVDIYLFKHLLDAIDINKTKLLLVFDSYQLPSVGCGNIAQDIIDSKLIPVVKLTKIATTNIAVMSLKTTLIFLVFFIFNSSL